MQHFEELWKQLERTVANGEDLTTVNLGSYLASLCTYLVMSATLALYIRLLYRKCSSSPSDTESFSRVFPLLALVTTGVIAVVKSSLALSLGLVGALSIVRFRAAIKDPEELVYLFLCIAIGLALGAEQPLLAMALVVVATVFIVGMHLTGTNQRQHRLLLTITGDADPHFANGEANVMATIAAVAGKHTLQRFDVENGRGQMRIVLGDSNPQKTADLIVKLREHLPGCDLSYVNLNSTL